MNCKDCCQDCQRIGCDIELECSGYVEPSNGTKERMDERLAMMHKFYPDAKPTNADRIRAMTDEELTFFFAETSRCSDWCNLYEKCKTKTNYSYSTCLETWNDWLKEESEEWQ